MKTSENLFIVSSGCWKRRSSLEKKLTVVSILATLVAIGLLIGLIVVAVDNNNNNNNNNDNPPDESLERICLTQECIAESAVVLRQMNQTADPYVILTHFSYVATFNERLFYSLLDVRISMNLLAEHF